MHIFLGLSSNILTVVKICEENGLQNQYKKHVLFTLQNKTLVAARKKGIVFLF